MMRMGLAAAVLAGSTFGAQAQAPASTTTVLAPPAVLAPHRAVYELSLLKSEGRDAPVSASGRIVYEFTGNACEGYTTNFRQLTETAPAEGETRSSDMRSSTHESGDGQNFRFRIEILSNGQRTKLLEGATERAGGTLSVSLRSPAPLKSDLPTDALFPVQQTLRGLAAVRAAETAVELKSMTAPATG